MRMYLPHNDPPVHADAAVRTQSYTKSRRQALKDEGLCPSCGGEPRDGISPKTDKPYILCKVCIDESYEKTKDRDAS